MLKKIMTGAALLGGAALYSCQAMAAADWGPCVPTEGTQQFNASMIQTVTDTSKNTSGTVFPDFYSWDLGQHYPGICECPDNNQTAPVYFKASTSLPFGHSSGDEKYYVVNDNIQIATSIWIEGQVKDYVNAPFPDKSNGNNTRQVCEDSSDRYISTGRKGKLSLYINHPFVGQLDIPSTNIMNLYGTKKSGVYSTMPLASVNLSGSITVPQGCELSSGSTLEIPFGDYKSSDFKDRKGTMPSGATKYTKELQFKCSNISDGVKISLRIEGTPNANDPRAIDMGSPDFGAIIEGVNGNVLIPNDTSSAQALDVTPLVDDIHRVATTTITAYPISTTGNAPKAGEFEGIATMRIDVE